MTNIKCPQCGRDFVRRVPRAGRVEILLSAFYVYPFRCQLCGHRFRSFQRGVRYVWVQEDRREYDRIEINFPVTFSGENVSGEGMLLNLSMGGCRFTTTADLATGMIVKLALQIPGSMPPVIVDAAVVVVRKADPGNASVEFLRWQEAERERLQHFIRGLLIGRGAESKPVAGVSAGRAIVKG
jgi:PilZ domain